MKAFCLVISILSSIASIQAQTDGVLPVNNGQNGACEELTVGLCQGVGYTSAYFPNFRNHETQSDAARELNDFRLLIESGCSPLVRSFFCSFYLPFCFTTPESNQVVRLRPCRSLCTETRRTCESVLVENSNFEWPTFLNCSLDTFPCDGSACFGPACSETEATMPTTFTSEGEVSFSLVAVNLVCI